MVQRPILIIGIGNPLRSDDGVGVYACEAIDKLQWSGVGTLTRHQLLPEIVLDMQGYPTVIIIDASVNAREVRLEKLDASDSLSISMSHHVTPSILLALQQSLEGRASDIFLCSIPVSNLDYGERLSTTALLHVQKAISLIADMVRL